MFSPFIKKTLRTPHSQRPLGRTPGAHKSRNKNKFRTLMPQIHAFKRVFHYKSSWTAWTLWSHYINVPHIPSKQQHFSMFFKDIFCPYVLSTRNRASWCYKKESRKISDTPPMQAPPSPLMLKNTQEQAKGIFFLVLKMDTPSKIGYTWMQEYMCPATRPGTCIFILFNIICFNHLHF